MTALPKNLPTEHRRLNAAGVALPRLGFGAAAIGNLYRAISDAQAESTLCAALAAGLHYFDTAPHYGFGLSESRLGKTLQDHAAPSTPIVISTKVGRLLAPVAESGIPDRRHGFVNAMPFEPKFDYTRDAIYKCFEESCIRLRTDRIDILLAHDLGSATHGAEHVQRFDEFMNGGYQAMCDLKKSGAVRAIGLGVNEWQVCEQAISTGEFDCFLLAGRYTLLEQTALDTFLPRCEQLGISIILGGPFNSGILAQGSRAANNAHYNYQSVPASVIEKVSRLEAACERHAIPLAAAALQFPLAHPCVASVIPGMCDPREVAAAMSMLNTRIPVALWKELKQQQLLNPTAPVPEADERIQ